MLKLLNRVLGLFNKPFYNYVILGHYFLAFLIVGTVNYISPMYDTFHEGEYLGNLFNILNYYKGLSEFPILIHGGMDFVPSLMAYFINSSATIFWTRIVNSSCTLIAWILYINTVVLLIRNERNRTTLAFFSLLGLYFLTPKMGSYSLVVQQAFLGTRDLFLMISLYGVAFLTTENKLSSSKYRWILALCAISAAFSFFWSYDRAIMTAALLSGFSIFLILRRHYLNLIILIGSSVFTVMALSWTKVMGNFFENLQSYFHWIKHSKSIWFMSAEARAGGVSAQYLVYVFSAIVLVLAAQWLYKNSSRTLSAFILSLIVAQLVLLAKLYDLPSAPLSYWCLWPLLLICIALLRNDFFLLPEKFVQDQKDAKNFRQGVFLFFCFLIVLNYPAIKLATQVVLFARETFKNGSVSDSDIVAPAIKSISADIINNKTECLLNWSNQGIFAFYSKTPFCGKYPYIVYLAPADQDEFIRQLKENTDKKYVIYYADFWSMSIYGRSMAIRLPKMDSFLKEAFRIQKYEGTSFQIGIMK